MTQFTGSEAAKAANVVIDLENNLLNDNNIIIFFIYIT